MTQQLDIYSNHSLVGYLRNDNDELTFTYDSNWVEDKNAHSISDDLPLSNEEYTGTRVYRYFDNLLPEGSIREFIEKAAHISKDNVFGLLERFGGDTSGSLSALPPGEKPTTDPKYLAVSTDDIKDFFQYSRGIPLRIESGESKMSLSGAQDKMTIFIDEKKNFYVPIGSASSNYIIKPSVSSDKGIPNTAINEALCMKLAKAIKFDVATTEYSPELDAVLVERYDRVSINGKLEKLHQQDFCQALGLSSKSKYQSESGGKLDIKMCFDACDSSIDPRADKKRLFEWLVFNVATGNMDCHAKNLSFVGTEHNKRLSPFYDLLCTLVYRDLTRKLAFKVGGQYKHDYIFNRHWDRLSEDINMKPALAKKWRLNVLDRIDKALPMVVADLKQYDLFPSDIGMLDKVSKVIEVKTQRMKNEALQIEEQNTEINTPENSSI